MDKPIYAAHNSPRSLPGASSVMADYDRMTYLVSHTFKHLDVFSGARVQHMFLALSRVYSTSIIWEVLALP